MSLIVCTECGKKFSDKAVCCPECGCPTEIVSKESKTPNVIAKKRQTSQQAAASILEEVKKAKSIADRAEKLFYSREHAIQLKASRNIDLFGGDATSRVVEIRADARRACSDLYTTYQSLVATLDGMCRPMLAYEPGGEAIKAVSDLIRYLNDESEIEDNCSASFNGMSLGSVANSKYMPSVSSKMIQKFWEGQYSTSTEGINAEVKRQEAAERNRQKHEIEQKKKNEREAAAKKHMNKVVTECHAKVDSYRDALNTEISNRLKQAIEKLEVHREQLATEKAILERELSSLGKFRIRERRDKKEVIRELDIRLAKLSDKGFLDAEEARLRQRAENAVKEYSGIIEQYLNMRFPNWHSSKKQRYAWSTVPDDVAFEDIKQAPVSYPEPPDASKVLNG